MTSTVLPTNLTADPSLDQLEIKLPRLGRTIEIRRQQNNQIQVERYRFNDQRFIAE